MESNTIIKRNVDARLPTRLDSEARRGAGPHSREFDALVRAIGECRSKAEEDAIVAAEVVHAQAAADRLVVFQRPCFLVVTRLLWGGGERLSGHALKECLVRLVYIDMLGHDASWGYVKALQACSDTNLATKRVGGV